MPHSVSQPQTNTSKLSLLLDQQNVLLRPDHIVELPDGPLRFTVKGTLEPDHSSSSHSLPTPAQVRN